MDISCINDMVKDLNLISAGVQERAMENRKRNGDEWVKTRFPDAARSMAEKGYTFTPESLKALESLMRGENLIMSGNVGTGKSFFFYTLGMPALSMTLASGKSGAELSRALEGWNKRNILIDDVGAETGKFVTYGTQMNLFAQILERRLDSPGKTHFTTNLSLEELEKRYDSRIVDRLCEMGKFHVLTGESRRNPDGIRRCGSWLEDFWKGPVWETCKGKCRFYDPASHSCLKGRPSEPRTCESCPWF